MTSCPYLRNIYTHVMYSLFIIVVFIFVDTLVFQVGALQLEGCSFDGVCLCENQHNSPSVSATPTCYLAWVLQVCEALHSSWGSLK